MGSEARSVVPGRGDEAPRPNWESQILRQVLVNKSNKITNFFELTYLRDRMRVATQVKSHSPIFKGKYPLLWRPMILGVDFDCLIVLDYCRCYKVDFPSIDIKSRFWSKMANYIYMGIFDCLNEGIYPYFFI